MRRLASYVVLAAVAALCTAGPAGAQAASPRIIGGSDTTIQDHPYQVVLFRDSGFICGGSILDATTVITAAHCVTRQTTGLTHTVYAASRFQIGYGSTNRNTSTRDQVTTIAVPQGYSRSSPDESYDVAILTLATPIPFSTTAQPIPLVDASQAKDTGNGYVTGWGNTIEGNNSSSPTTLQGVSVPLQPDSACASTYGSDYVAARGVCAGGGSQASGNPDTCQGDSGGPLAVQVGGAWQLLGLTSYGNGCGEQDTPAVYTYVRGTDVSEFIDSRGANDGSATGGTGTGGSGAGGSGATTPPTVTSPVTGSPAGRPAVPTIADTARPTVRMSRFSCTRKRRCTISFASADAGGRVARFTAVVARKVRNCSGKGSKRFCRTGTRRKVLKVKRTSGGFVATGTLTKATYTLTAVATDSAGNRSKRLSRTLRVR